MTDTSELVALMVRYAQLGRLLPNEIDEDCADETRLVLAEMDKVRQSLLAALAARSENVTCLSKFRILP